MICSAYVISSWIFTYRSSDDVEKTARRLGAWHESSGEMAHGRVSISAMRNLLMGVVTVTVLSDATSVEFVMGVRCSCGTYAMLGHCPHELFVRYLEGDAKLDLRELHDLTRKMKLENADKPLQAYMLKKKAMVKLPSASEWRTMTSICTQAQKRTLLRQQKARERQKSFFLLFNPKCDQVVQSDDAVEEPRESQSKQRQQLLKGLCHDAKSGDFSRMFGAVTSMVRMEVTIEEAKDSGCGVIVSKLSKDKDISLPLRSLAQRAMQLWRAGVATSAATASVQPRVVADRGTTVSDVGSPMVSGRLPSLPVIEAVAGIEASPACSVLDRPAVVPAPKRKRRRTGN